jgi:hypothetical protein
MLRDWAKFAGFSAILAFVLTGSFLSALEPSIKKNEGAQQSEPQAPNALEGPTSEPWLVVFRVLLPGGLQSISQYCNAYGEHEKKKWPQAYYCELKITDVWLAISTGLLVGVTGLLGYTAYRQETMARLHERAYISGGGPLRLIDKKTGDYIKPDEGWITIENYGRTQAILKKFEWGFCDKKIFPKDRAVSEIIDYGLIPKELIHVIVKEDVHPPNTTFRQYRSPGPFSLSEQNGKIFFGRYTYLDVFHDEHYSTFVLELGPDIGESSSPPGGYSDWN